MSRPLSTHPSSIGARKASSKLRRSSLQLKNKHEMTESSRTSRAFLHMHRALSDSQPDEVTQLSAHDEKSNVAWACEKRRAAPMRASRM